MEVSVDICNRYGAIDPSSGTSAMMEIARVLGNLHKDKTKKWRPRRTIVFASWAAEEFGLMGAREWVDHHIQKLTDGAVAIINIDMCLFGDILIPTFLFFIFYHIFNGGTGRLL